MIKITNLYRKTWSLTVLAGTIGLMWACSGAGNHTLEISKLAVDGGKAGKNTIFIGSPFLFSVNLSAPDTLASLEITLKDAAKQAVMTDQYDFSPLTSVSFNEKMKLPVHLEAGDYTLEVTLTDKSGQRVSETTTLKLVVDSSLPVVSDLDIGINSKGNDLHLEAGIYAAHKLADVTVKIIGTDWQNETVFNGARLVGQVSSNFHEHVHVDQAPAGEYQVILVVKDQAGNEASASGSFTKK